MLNLLSFVRTRAVATAAALAWATVACSVAPPDGVQPAHEDRGARLLDASRTDADVARIVRALASRGYAIDLRAADVAARRSRWGDVYEIHAHALGAQGGQARLTVVGSLDDRVFAVIASEGVDLSTTRLLLGLNGSEYEAGVADTDVLHAAIEASSPARSAATSAQGVGAYAGALADGPDTVDSKDATEDPGAGDSPWGSCMTLFGNAGQLGSTCACTSLVITCQGELEAELSAAAVGEAGQEAPLEHVAGQLVDASAGATAELCGKNADCASRTTCSGRTV